MSNMDYYTSVEMVRNDPTKFQCIATYTMIPRLDWEVVREFGACSFDSPQHDGRMPLSIIDRYVQFLSKPNAPF